MGLWKHEELWSTGALKNRHMKSILTSVLSPYLRLPTAKVLSFQKIISHHLWNVSCNINSSIIRTQCGPGLLTFPLLPPVLLPQELIIPVAEMTNCSPTIHCFHIVEWFLGSGCPARYYSFQLPLCLG